jgi:hypothetical protein
MTQARVDEIKEDYLKVSGSVQWEGRKEKKERVDGND